MTGFIAVVFYCATSLGGCEFWADETTLHATERACYVSLAKLGEATRDEYADARIYGTCIPLKLVTA